MIATAPQNSTGKTVYTTKGETDVSWYQDDPRLSLELIGAFAPTEGGRIIDVGGGASVLVDRLLACPFERVTVLDISETSLAKAKVAARRACRTGRVGRRRHHGSRGPGDLRRLA